jgi:Tol biopolymer transport system component
VVALGLLLFLATILVVGPREGNATFPGANGDLVIESSRDDDYQLFRINSDGGNPMKLTTQGDNFEAAWSPDGSRIVFSRAPEGNDNLSDIWVMNADGTDQNQLTNDPEQDSLPAWSADGIRIAFRRGSTPASQIWIMDSDGENEEMIIDLPGTDSAPAFSPDGAKLAFSHRPFDEDFDIYIANADGSGPVPITSNDTFDSLPSWSPDATRLAFECEPEEGESNDVCLIDPTERTSRTSPIILLKTSVQPGRPTAP